MQLITINHYQVYMTCWHFQGHGFKGQCHEQRLPNMHVSGCSRRILCGS